nr:MAG TPA: hypothetical protein [Caudoviricetes sp.]
MPPRRRRRPRLQPGQPTGRRYDGAGKPWRRRDRYRRGRRPRLLERHHNVPPGRRC